MPTPRVVFRPVFLAPGRPLVWDAHLHADGPGCVCISQGQTRAAALEAVLNDYEMRCGSPRPDLREALCPRITS